MLKLKSEAHVCALIGVGQRIAKEEAKGVEFEALSASLVVDREMVRKAFVAAMDIPYCEWVLGAVASWFDIVGSKSGHYYAVAGDIKGLAWVMPVERIEVLYAGIKHILCEDSDNYFVGENIYPKSQDIIAVLWQSVPE